MKTLIEQAIAKARKVKHIFVASVDGVGVPHLAVAGEITQWADLVAVSSWYCPVTLSNIEKNPEISLVIWDVLTDSGFQIICRYQQIRELAVLDGYSPRKERRGGYPQIERQLLLRVEKIMPFSQALHSDIEEI